MQRTREISFYSVDHQMPGTEWKLKRQIKIITHTYKIRVIYMYIASNISRRDQTINETKNFFLIGVLFLKTHLIFDYSRFEVQQISIYVPSMANASY